MMLIRRFEKLSVCALVIATLTCSSSSIAQAKVPQTVEEHTAMAKSYLEKAAAYRKDAADHRAMSAEYRKAVPQSPKAGENPWARKMEKHCTAIAAEDDKLAAEVERAAEYHTLRAKELTGK